MSSKVIFLVFIVAVSIITTAECAITRKRRSSDEPSKNVKFYIECPEDDTDDAMVSAPSESQPVKDKPQALKLFRSIDTEKSPLEKTIFPKKVLKSGDPTNIKPNLELPKINLDKLKNVRSSLRDLVASKTPEESPEEVDNASRISDGLINILEKEKQQGRFTNMLKNYLSSRKNQDSNSSPSELVQENEPEEIAPIIDESSQQSSIIEKIKATADENRRILSNALSDAKNKLAKLENIKDIEVRASNNLEESKLMPLVDKVKVAVEEQKQALEEAINSAKSKIPKLQSRSSILDNEPGSSNNIMSQALQDKINELKNIQDQMQPTSLVDKVRATLDERKQKLEHALNAAKNKLSEPNDAATAPSENMMVQMIQKKLIDLKNSQDQLQFNLEKARMKNEERKQGLQDAIDQLNNPKDVEQGALNNAAPQIVQQPLNEQDERPQSDSLAEKLRATLEEKKQVLEDALKAAKNKLSIPKDSEFAPSENSVSQIVQQKFNEIKQDQSQPSMLVEKAKSALEERKLALEEALNAVKTKLSIPKDSEQGASNNMPSQIVQQYQPGSLAEKVRTAAEEHKQALQGAINAAKNKFVNSNVQEKEASEDVVKEALNEPEQLQPTLLTEKAKATLEQRKKKLGEALNAAKTKFSSLKDAAPAPSEKASQIVQQTLNELKNKEQIQPGFLADKTKTILEERKQAIEGALEAAKNKLPKLEKKLESNNPIVRASNNDVSPPIQNIQMQPELTLADKVKNSIEEKKRAVHEALAAARNRLHPNDVDTGESNINSVSQIVQGQEPTLAEKVKAVADRHRKELQESIAAARNKLHKDAISEAESEIIQKELAEFGDDGNEQRESTLGDNVRASLEKQKKAVEEALADKMKTTQLGKKTIVSDTVAKESKPDIVSSQMDQSNEEAIEQPHQETLAERLKVAAEAHMNELKDRLIAAKNKISNQDNVMNTGDADTGESNMMPQIFRDDSAQLRNLLAERARLLQRKFSHPFQSKPNIRKSILPSRFDNDFVRQAPTNNDFKPQIGSRQGFQKFPNLLDKTKDITQRLNQLTDRDMNGEIQAIKELRETGNKIVPKFETLVRESKKLADESQPLVNRLKNIMRQNPRTAESPITKRQEVSGSNPEPALDTSEKFSKVKTKMIEGAKYIGEKVKNFLRKVNTSLNESPTDGKDSVVDNSNVNEVVREAPNDKETSPDMDGARSDIVSKETPIDDIINLSNEGSRTADICKCMRIAFPEKFENGHFVMKSKDDVVASPFENSIIPKLHKIQFSSPLGNKLRNALRRNNDQSTSPDEMKPVFATPSEGLDREMSSVERAKMADQGIRSLLEFVKIVDQVDQYISTRARKAISRLASALAEDDDARIL